MKKRTLVFLIIGLNLLLAANASATAMSESRSKCYSMESIAQSYSVWKTDYHRFLADYHSLSPDLRYRASVSAMTKIVSKIIDLKRIGGVPGYDGVISDANRLISDINSNNITQAGATRVLRTGLNKLEEAMDDVVYRAQVKNDCQLEAKAAAVSPTASSSR